MSLPPGLARLVADFQRYGSDVVTQKMEKVPGKPQPPDPAPRPTGLDAFDAMTEAEQDELLGPDVAEAVRSGKVNLEDLVVEHQMETEDNFIAQATPQDLGIPPRDT